MKMALFHLLSSFVVRPRCSLVSMGIHFFIISIPKCAQGADFGDGASGDIPVAGGGNSGGGAGGDVPVGGGGGSGDGAGGDTAACWWRQQ